MSSPSSSSSDQQKRLAEFEAQRQRLLHSRSAPRQPTFWQTPAGHTVSNMALGFAMGSVVGSSVIFMHCLLSKIPINKQSLKNMAGGGAAFGTIFAVGSLMR